MLKFSGSVDLPKPPPQPSERLKGRVKKGGLGLAIIHLIESYIVNSIGPQCKKPL